MSDVDVLRRIAERGLKLSQEEVEKGRLDPRGHLDLWHHMLDEIERAKQKYEPDTGKTEVVEINLEDESISILALEAHRRNITLNQYMNDVLAEYIRTYNETHREETDDGTSND